MKKTVHVPENKKSIKESMERDMASPELPEQTIASSNFPVVAIGASAGGLEALLHLVENLTPDTHMAYVLVQHLDPHHKSMLVDILSRRSSMPVLEVRRKTKVEADHIYVIPPNRNMYLEEGHLCLCPREADRAKTMPIDYLFRTLAIDQPGNCIGVILSGTGSDGSLGIEEIKATGGITFVQEPETAKFDGMPRFAISTGHVDYVLSADAIALELRRIARHPFTSGKRIAELSQGNLLLRIFNHLKARTGVDFKHYKQNTVKRRIFRRMAICKTDSLEEYVKKLNQDPEEIDALYQDLLIKVTCFFREPESFRLLQENIFPTWVRNRNRNRKEPIRIWVPACSTGEEVYSLAIALLESAGDLSSALPIQIFGTDVSDEALTKARAGIYIENIALDVSPERLRRWFNRTEAQYQISKQIRDMCVFARHNVVTDPPFSQMDLISCRNLLIYFDSVFQSKVMPIFHYSLRPSGYLMLGSSESVGPQIELFTPIDAKTKIYSVKTNSNLRSPFSKNRSQPDFENPAPLNERKRLTNPQLEADQLLVARFAPPAVIVDEDLKILHVRGSTGDFLEPSPGRMSLSLIKMARGNLGLELRTLFHRARTSKKVARNEGFRFEPKEGAERELLLEIIPLKGEITTPSTFLVLFADKTAPAPAVSQDYQPHPDTDLVAENASLRLKLTEANAYLQSTIEDSEATNEALKSASEEIRSSNEELQSTNEELETAKEELQSSNEELTTVNEEVQVRNRDLNRLNSDLTNFLSSVNIPIIMLSTDLKIRRFTPLTHRVFNLIPTDIGRSLGDIKPKVNANDLEKAVLQVIDTLTIQEREVRDEEGRFYRLYIRPYRTQDNRVEGAVLIFQDVDAIQRSVFALQESKAYAESIVEAVMDPLLVLDQDFKVLGANSAYYTFFKTKPSQTENRSIYHLDKSQWDKKSNRAFFKKFNPKGPTHPVLEVTEAFSRIGEKTLQIKLKGILRPDDSSNLILMALSDYTERKEIEKERQRLHAALQKEKLLLETVLQQAQIGVAIFEPQGKLLLANRHLSLVLGFKIPATANLKTFANLPATKTNGVSLSLKEWPMCQSLASKVKVEEKQIILRKGKASRTILRVSSSPILDSKGELLAVVALFHDVTERFEVQAQIVEAGSREQRRIAEELHDGLSQQLAAIAYRLNALKSRLTREKSSGTSDVAVIGKMIEKSVSGSRDLARMLLPVEMDSSGLMHSLEELCRSCKTVYNVPCTFKCEKPVLLPNPEISTTALRIAQEAVHNAVKHGKPKNICLQLKRIDGLVQISVSNDGLDYQAKNKRQNRGMGLQIMQHRAELIQGNLTIEAQKPRGTRVVCTFKG